MRAGAYVHYVKSVRGREEERWRELESSFTGSSRNLKRAVCFTARPPSRVVSFALISKGEDALAFSSLHYVGRRSLRFRFELDTRG